MKRSMRLYITIATICLFTLTLAACGKTPGVSRKTQETTTQGHSTTTVSAKDKRIANQTETFWRRSEAMDYFFRTYFSGNFVAAYQATSSSFRKSYPFEVVDKRWRVFYAKATRCGLTRKNLNYRSDFRTGDGDVSGIVITPSGRMAMRIYFSQLGKDHGNYWVISDVLLFDKALGVTSGNGRERIILTDKPDDPTFKEIHSLIMEGIVIQSKVHDEISIKQLIVSDGWARALFAPVHVRGFETEQVILRRVGGKWKIVTFGTGTTLNGYPESPYTIWAASDWK